jgi:hypothetical protein
VDGAGKRELLSSPAGASVGEGELRNLFEGEELRIMLFNYNLYDEAVCLRLSGRARRGLVHLI